LTFRFFILIAFNNNTGKLPSDEGLFYINRPNLIKSIKIPEYCQGRSHLPDLLILLEAKVIKT